MGATPDGVLSGGERWVCVQGDCIAGMRTLPDDCVHCCVTSPPYYGLRDYGTATWDGGDPDCQHTVGGQVQDSKAPGAIKSGVRPGCDASKCRKCGAVRIDQQIGLEGTPEEYVARMVDVFREVRRILHPSGSLWLNLGDSYAANGRYDAAYEAKRERPALNGGDRELAKVGAAPRKGIRGADFKPKDLIGIPWMVAFALRADGWYLRQWCPWVKRNPMPESVTDRPGTACETVFLLSKRADYFFDMEAVKRVAAPATSIDERIGTERPADFEEAEANYGGKNSRSRRLARNAVGNGETRNFRSSDLWFDTVGMLLASEEPDPFLLGLDVTLKPYKGAHFAVMPKKLIEPCVLAGTSAAGVCPKCGEPWARVVEKKRVATRPGRDTKVPMSAKNRHREETGMQSPKSTPASISGNRDPERHCTTTETVGWNRQCDCGAYEAVPAVVFDPFAGSGTVLQVAVDKGRRALGTELNPDYIALIERRMKFTTPSLFTEADA